jgi:hypothetical protein
MVEIEGEGVEASGTFREHGGDAPAQIRSLGGRCLRREAGASILSRRCGPRGRFRDLRKHQPWFVVECKEKARTLDPNLKYLLERVKVPFAFQISATGKDHVRLPDGAGCEVHQMSAVQFLSGLP